MSDASKDLKSFHVQFDSMEPTIQSGSDVVAHMSYYKEHRPERWDVVLFGVSGTKGSFIKRIVGLPGEKISVAGDCVKVNGSPVPPPAHLKGCYSSSKGGGHKYKVTEISVPKDSVFVMGDNPNVVVADSREHGAVPINKLEAKVFAAVNLTIL